MYEQVKSLNTWCRRERMEMFSFKERTTNGIYFDSLIIRCDHLKIKTTRESEKSRARQTDREYKQRQAERERCVCVWGGGYIDSDR